MSLNQVLMKFFNLPPAVRMMLAVAGFGSLASIVYFMLPSLRTRQGRVVLLIIAVVGVVLFLVIWGLRRMFVGRKSKQLDQALESQGPTRGDIAEQERIYREKFRGKLGDLKTNGLSIYRLPWFVLVGEPGCGKTASLIHSGLDFPLGRDEVPGFGGTRNYNWWFTNEAVILDTAGRIAFHEEGTTDKVEWEYFCKLLKLNRPRCPINGVIIAIPADKLLRDSPEERAQKATVLRERLRQVHQLLGVRFPTFVLVTKMDLVGGFNEFFEEIRVDLQQRNQMCGWSRPGEFQEPYDPATFPEAFDQVYDRLRDWGMRYLQRKTTEDELGMIVTFPEAVRELRQPLHDYIATIFQKSPLLEPPFFRGFYFTSAVQEGAPILDVFEKAGGHTVSQRPPRAADSKAFFIHDFYAHKVFPENGLVFRSAKHVSLNRRMRRMVWIGSAAMIVLMVTLFAFGAMGVRGLVNNPRDACRAAAAAIEKGGGAFEDLPGHLRLAKDLAAYYEDYGGAWNALRARALFIGADISHPQEMVGRIHARFVLDCVVQPVLREVESRLATAELKLGMPSEVRLRYLDAVRVYTQWYGEVVGQYNPAALDGQEAVLRRTEFEHLLRFAEVQGERAEDAAEQFERALRTLSAQPRSFARDVLGETLGFARGDHQQRATDTICAAIGRITNYWKPLTDIRADSTDPRVRYWAAFADRLGELRQRYEQILKLREAFGERYAPAREKFLELTQRLENIGDLNESPPAGTLNEAFYNFARFLENTPVPETQDHRVIRLGQLLDEFADRWNSEFQMLESALAKGAQEPDRTVRPQAAVYAAIDEGREALQASFRGSMRRIRERLGVEDPRAEPLDVFTNQGLIYVEEAHPPETFDGPAKVRLAPNPFGTRERVKLALLELREMLSRDLEGRSLDNLETWPDLLNEMTAQRPTGPVLSAWVRDVQEVAGAAPPDRQLISQKSGFADRPFWQPYDLYQLVTGLWSSRQSYMVATLLDKMADRAEQTISASTMPGLGRLMPDFDQPAPGLPFDRHQYNMPRQVQPHPVAKQEEPQQEEPEFDPFAVGRTERPAEQPGGPNIDAFEQTERRPLLTRYHTREFLAETSLNYARVRQALESRAGGQRTLDALKRAEDAYIQAYFEDWYEIYTDPTKLLDAQTLSFLQQLGDGELSWPQYVQTLTEGDQRDLAMRLAQRMEALIREVVFFAAAPNAQELPDSVRQQIRAALDGLNQKRRSLFHQLYAMAERRNLPAEGEPALVYSRQVESAWRNYLEELRAIGTLQDERATAGSPPDLKKLQKQIVYEQATTRDFHLIRPLLDIAAFGQELLLYDLNQKLADVFQPHAGQYPIVHPDRARDDTPAMVHLARLAGSPLDAATFLDVLRQAAEFERSYGELFAELASDSSAMRTLESCRAWAEFLYDEPQRALRGEDPDRLEIMLALVEDRAGRFLNAGSAYEELKLSVPLLSEFNAAAEPIEARTRSGEGLQAATVQEAVSGPSARKYRWDLKFSGAYPPFSVEVSNRNPRVGPQFPERVESATLPGSPWTLLMLIGARPENDLDKGYWKIPVRMESQAGLLGFAIGLRIERTFPGPIPPPEKPARRPAMERAREYLTAKGN